MYLTVRKLHLLLIKMPLIYYFSINFNIKVTVVKDRKEFETKYPLYEAVNRCSRGKEHAHTLDSSAFFLKQDKYSLIS